MCLVSEKTEAGLPTAEEAYNFFTFNFDPEPQQQRRRKKRRPGRREAEEEGEGESGEEDGEDEEEGEEERECEGEEESEARVTCVSDRNKQQKLFMVYVLCVKMDTNKQQCNFHM